MSNLLVVDWDYFFYNPMHAGDMKNDLVWMYDWAHEETEPPREWLWQIRAASFYEHDLSLPTVDVIPGWWDRFTIVDDAMLYVHDSNLWSIRAGYGQHFDHVWLYDAHHDMYPKIESWDQLREWAQRGIVTCEDWMFGYLWRGSKLHWRWPQWYSDGKATRQHLSRFVRTNLDAQKDDLGKLDPHMEFDAVSVCRSGAWVPPWCDNEFVTFYQGCPVAEIEQLDDVELVREWDDSLARADAEELHKAKEELVRRQERG